MSWVGLFRGEEDGENGEEVGNDEKKDMERLYSYTIR
jgi:hypothetical protein